MQRGEGHTASWQRQTESRFQTPPETTLQKQSRPVKEQTFNQQRRDSFGIQALLRAAEDKNLCQHTRSCRRAPAVHVCSRPVAPRRAFKSAASDWRALKRGRVTAPAAGEECAGPRACARTQREDWRFHINEEENQRHETERWWWKRTEVQPGKDEQTNRMICLFVLLSLKIPAKPKRLPVGGTSVRLEESPTSCSGILQRNPAASHLQADF